MNKKRWASLILILAGAVYAYYGGDFTTPEYREMRRAEVAARDSLILLRREIDSLSSFRDSLANDPAVREHFARQEWGLVRPGEILINLVPTPVDSARE